ncbi:Domain of Uncharacterised Function (DUF350) [Actinomyces bovis]|uniref:Domain of Uncharacterized Function (DUF350) n=1 Tax=Actinomyces bovis TaxID=1658 RepID=A0ABY1VQT1_9ACTO|nr:DUF350 domain-containing protein [Actinomyces bovis]SPT54158.1 Domain of Uncharacterised Function (DUF350) [Actinomyces bovis]VEG53579.1 Domain of Uncharacterised Function (DUF350) [Actinomyces israelii]
MNTLLLPTSLGAGLDGISLLATVVYALLGMVLLLFAVFASKVFRLDLRRELLEDQNPALGTAIGGMAIAIAIIIAATILG